MESFDEHNFLSKTNNTMQFGVGVIGATGFIGKPYRREIRESTGDTRIVALCARRRDLLEAAGQEDGALLLTEDWRQIVDHPDVNFVIVATPDALHHEAGMACARAGKHLLCEKPVGSNVQEAREMWHAYRDAGLAHYVPFWTRYLPAFIRAREMVQSGALGEICSVVYRWHNPRPAAMPFTWRDDVKLSSAGSIADVGSHAYDCMCWIIGEEAVRVLAHADVVSPAKPDLGAINLGEALAWGTDGKKKEATATRKGTAYDYANISFVMQNGAVGSLILSHAPSVRKGLAPELELHGTEKSLSVDRVRGTLTITSTDQEPEILESFVDEGFGNRFEKHVFPAIRAQLANQDCLHPGLHDGYRVQLFTDAAALSGQKGQWINLADLDPA